MSKNESDQAFERFKELRGRINKDFSESDTRAKIIDPLFTNCLGWTEEEIRRELHVHKGYLDYVFSIEGIPKFVFEAKKVGRTFNIPDSMKSRYYKIYGTITTDKNIKQAITQAQQYCIESGVKYGVISNGHQYILFEAFKYGSSWRYGQCVVFRSLKDIEKNFTTFWNMLSKTSVMNGSLRKYISQEEPPLEFHRPIEYLHAKASPITRNDMSPLLQPFIDYVFKDIIDETQLNVLKNCYVARRQYRIAGFQINRHFDRPPGFAEKYKVEIIFESGAKAGKFEELYEKSEKFLRTEAPRGSLILLMGGIGCGKTTFIHHFFNFVIKKPKRTLWFYVDFTNAPRDPLKIEEYIFRSIIQDFEHRYQDALKQELSSVGLNTFKPDSKMIPILFSMLILKGFTISLVLDNVDQHSYISPEYQEHALLVAKNLTEKLKTITILTLREESFFKSTMSGVLDAFLVPVFHIPSPSFEDLTRYRIDFVLDLLKKGDEEIATATRSHVKLGASKEVVKMFFEIIKNSLRSTRRVGEEILRFMDDISGGDMRKALGFFRTFLVSGNTDVNEMLRIETLMRDKGERYNIPFHHVIKSIILEHSRIYSSSRSRIMNLFDVDAEHTNSHFLHLRILNYLYSRMGYQPAPGRGYVEIDSIIREAERMMINRAAISSSMTQMARFGLVEFENQSNKGYDRATYVRITNTGIYYLNNLVHQFVYLDLVWMDTPIADKRLTRGLLDYVVELRPYKAENELEERFERTELFLNYLKEIEEREFKNNPEFKDSDLTRKTSIPEIIESYEKMKRYIRLKRQAPLYPDYDELAELEE